MLLSRLPNGLTICLSSLVCAGVVLLQNAGSYANRLEPVVNAVSVDAFMTSLPEQLRTAGSVSKAAELNTLEILNLKRIEAFAASVWQRYVPEWEWGAEVPAESEEAAVVQPLVQQEAEAEPEAEPAAADEPVDEPAPAAAPVVAEPAHVAAPTSPCWPMLSAALVKRSFQDRFSDNTVHTVFYLSRTQAEPVEEPAAPAEPEQPVVEEPAAPAEPEQPVVEEPTVPAEPEQPVVEEPAAPAEPEQPVAEEPAAPAEPEQPVVEEPAAPAEPEQPVAEEPAAQAPLAPAPEPAAVAAVVAPEQQQDEPPQQEPETPPMNCRIMMVGDSLMEDLGPLTHRMMSHRKGLQFVISAKYSTGLCRPDYFNWPAHMREQVAKRPPDLVVFFIGANDGMSIKEGRKIVPTGGREWIEAYMSKMDEMVGIAREAGADIIWVEMPAVGGRYNKLLHQTQKAQREYCETHGLTTLRTDPFLSGVWGKFEPFGTYKGRTTRLRSKDVTHLTTNGNKKLLEYLMPVIERRLAAFYAAHPERQLSPEAVAKIRKVPVTYTCKYTPPEKKAAPEAAAQPSKP